MTRSRILLSLLLLLALPVAGAGAPSPPPPLELVHPAGGHDVHVSAPALAVDATGKPLVAWTTGGHDGNTAFVARPGDGGAPVRVSPAGMSVDSLHQAPGLAVGPGGEVYVTWSATKPKPAGALFASDLYLSRSLDGGRTFEAPLRVNDDRPIAHSFEDLAVAADGTAGARSPRQHSCTRTTGRSPPVRIAVGGWRPTRAGAPTRSGTRRRPRIGPTCCCRWPPTAGASVRPGA
jgi:hypothetical protein